VSEVGAGAVPGIGAGCGAGAGEAVGEDLGVRRRRFQQDANVFVPRGAFDEGADPVVVAGHQCPGVEHAAQEGGEVGPVPGAPLGVGDDRAGLGAGAGPAPPDQLQAVVAGLGEVGYGSVHGAPAGPVLQARVVMVPGGDVGDEPGVVQAPQRREEDLQVDGVEQRLALPRTGPGQHVALPEVGEAEPERGGGE
jgi:hypothetical protein